MKGTSNKIKLICNEESISLSELADRLNTTRQNLNNKMKRDNFKEEELLEIAKALNCEYKSYFINKNGQKY